MNNGNLIFEFAKIKQELNFIGKDINIEHISTKIEDKVKKIPHIVGKYIVTHIQTILLLLMEDTNSNFNLFYFIFSYEDKE